MEQLQGGFLVSLSAAREMLRLWPAYWRVIQPWGYIYIGLWLLHGFFHPDNTQNWVMAVLWQILFLSLILLMAWNWANALVGGRGHLDLQHGWENSDWKEYIGGMLILLIALPVVLMIAVAIPVALLLLLLGQEENPEAIYTMSAIMGGILMFFYARFLPLSAALIARQSSPLPTVWRQTERQQFFILAAFITLIVANLAVAAIISFIAGLVVRLGWPRHDLVILPLVILTYFYMTGWLVLLSQRTFALLTGRSHDTR